PLAATEIRTLLQSAAYWSRSNIIGRFAGTTIWIRNVAFNLVSLATILAGLLLLADGALEEFRELLSGRPFPVTTIWASALGLFSVAVVLLRVLLQSQRDLPDWPNSLVTFALAATSFIVAWSALIPIVLHLSQLETWLTFVGFGVAMAIFCIGLGIPREASLRIRLAHVASATV